MLDRIDFLFAAAIREKGLLMFYPWIQNLFFPMQLLVQNLWRTLTVILDTKDLIVGLYRFRFIRWSFSSPFFHCNLGLFAFLFFPSFTVCKQGYCVSEFHCLSQAERQIYLITALAFPFLSSQHLLSFYRKTENLLSFPFLSKLRSRAKRGNSLIR